MRFADVIGQEKVKHNLTEMFYNNRVSHALLFLGREGAGALPMAIAFSQFLVCEKVQGKNDQSISLFGEADDTGIALQDACGTCPACIKASQLAHPDIHFSYPTIKKTSKSDEKPVSTDFIVQWRDFIKEMPYGSDKDWVEFIKEHPYDKIDNPTNKQGNITAEECNDIIRKLSLKSFESSYKILILWMPEYMTKLGQGNKLLKLIEEPPPNTILILVAENETEILPTIISRCQLIKITALNPKDIEQAMIRRENCLLEQAKMIANGSEGSYREALQILQHSDEAFHTTLKDWLNAIFKYGPITQVKLIEEIARLGREKQKQFLRYFLHCIEQAVQLQVAEEELKTYLLSSMSEPEKDLSVRLNKAISLEQKEAIAKELNKASYYIERNANAKILFHALTIKIFHIVKNNLVVA